MLSDVYHAVTSFFAMVFALFTSWHIPGTNVTPAILFGAFLIMTFFYSLFRSFFSNDK